MAIGPVYSTTSFKDSKRRLYGTRVAYGYNRRNLRRVAKLRSRLARYGTRAEVK